MNDKVQWRKRAQTALQRYFEKRSAPRTILTLFLIMTGLFAFLVSFVSLHLGLEWMWLRYPFAVITGYAFFLGLLRLWVEMERSRFSPEGAELEVLVEQEEGVTEKSWNYERRSGWLDWLDIPTNLIDFDEGCLPVVLVILALGLVIGLVALLTAVIAAAPAFLAEVFLDAVMVSMLYRRLRIAAEEHWLGTAIRRTWWLVLIATFLLSLVGWGLAKLAPGSHSIGPAIKRILHS